MGGLQSLETDEIAVEVVGQFMNNLIVALPSACRMVGFELLQVTPTISRVFKNGSLLFGQAALPDNSSALERAKKAQLHIGLKFPTSMPPDTPGCPYLVVSQI